MIRYHVQLTRIVKRAENKCKRYKGHIAFSDLTHTIHGQSNYPLSIKPIYLRRGPSKEKSSKSLTMVFASLADQIIENHLFKCLTGFSNKLGNGMWKNEVYTCGRSPFPSPYSEMTAAVNCSRPDSL